MTFLTIVHVHFTVANNYYKYIGCTYKYCIILLHTSLIPTCMYGYEVSMQTDTFHNTYMYIALVTLSIPPLPPSGNPALDLLTSLPVMLTPGVSEFTLEMVGLYNTDGRTLVARASDYTLQFVVDGQTEEVESFGATTFDQDPYRRYITACASVLGYAVRVYIVL